MKISEMTAWEMAERMGDESTEREGEKMRELCLSAGHAETEDIPENEWFRLMDATLYALL